MRFLIMTDIEGVTGITTSMSVIIKNRIIIPAPSSHILLFYL